MSEAIYSKASFKTQDANFRIEIIISDGMWYDFIKWRKLSKVTEEELSIWIEKKLGTGELLQSDTGARSYRYPHESILKFYKEHELDVKAQLVDFLFPPRIWGGLTETEGFLNAPLREIGIVSFVCIPRVAEEVAVALKGIARVREDQPGSYRAYGLSSPYIKDVITNVFDRHPEIDIGKVYSRAESHRREMVDFNREFGSRIVEFYTKFGKALARREKETIQIFLPDPEDQRSQMIMWVITAIEKFNESASVPFSGYLNSVLKRWPYDLPLQFLGKDLSEFQRKKSKALTKLRIDTCEEERSFTAKEISDEMNISIEEFADLEDKNKTWGRAQNATTITWGETSDEKESTSIMGDGNLSDNETDFILASDLSFAVIDTALSTGLYLDALAIIGQIDASEMDKAKLGMLSKEFVVELGTVLNLKK